jgi:hypothetical protein
MSLVWDVRLGLESGHGDAGHAPYSLYNYSTAMHPHPLPACIHLRSLQALAATATGNGAGGSSSGSEGSVASDVAAIASAAQGLAALLEQAAALRTAGGGAAGLKAGNASTGWPGEEDWDK